MNSDWTNEKSWMKFQMDKFNFPTNVSKYSTDKQTHQLSHCHVWYHGTVSVWELILEYNIFINYAVLVDWVQFVYGLIWSINQSLFNANDRV